MLTEFDISLDEAEYMPPRVMTPEEIIIRRSIEVLQATIEDLCLKRDALAAALPNAPRPAVMKISPFTGREIKQGGGKKRKAVKE